MTHRYLLFFPLLLLSVSCVSSGSYSELKEQYDSIALRNQVYEQEVFHTDSLVASVLANFQQIEHIESMIDLNPQRGASSKSLQERIDANMQQIADKLEANHQALEELSQKLQKSNDTNSSLYLMVQMLKQQHERQREQIESIGEEIELRSKAIESLEAHLKRLRREAHRLDQEQKQRAESLLAREQALNLVHYCLGTKGDLAEMRLYRNDRISVDRANLDYLTQVDKRTFISLPLQSKEAKIHSVHPSSTYKLEADGRGALTLRITDSEGFWRYARILIVEVF